jgi:hypothetical protein
MHTRIQSPLIIASTVAFALFAMSCGNEPDSTVDARSATAATDSAVVAQQNASASAQGTTAMATTTEPSNTSVMTVDTTEIHINPSAVGKPQYNERFTMSKDIRGYRAQLMAELTAIRSRLNDGTRTDEATKQDKDRAAVLAQGLERMDRLIKAVEESDDVTWTTIRTSQLKEADEVRSWAAKNGYRSI